MLEISAEALQKIKDFIKNKEKQEMRIYLVSDGCNGPRLTMAFEGAKINDILLNNQEISVYVDMYLMAEIEALTISIDDERAFLLEPKKPYTKVSACSARCGGCGIINRSIVPFSKIFNSEALC